MSEVNEESPFFKLGAALAECVFAPDYYHGPWYVTFRGRKKRCKSYTTAKAWANYLQRQGYSAAFDRIVIGKLYPSEG